MCSSFGIYSNGAKKTIHKYVKIFYSTRLIILIEKILKAVYHLRLTRVREIKWIKIKYIKIRIRSD